ncbi:NUDIX hydrolase [Planomicrobium sp. Y74]|uniref:NUDIX domain-containing protein n=1 Tax=Planomicrobium sp. Y74 TaxID=2478977 RepID=UPI000EF537E1|nr:NUDIX hydrolase [Planomicrobium sp. Y74]RLQ92227.1 NUDIX hydrolase [Planomicrobium sp. Y74]
MSNNYPKHIVAVSAYITNAEGEALLIKAHWRKDTWEPPGGQVEQGEALDEAVRREVMEETGIEIDIHGITGVYYNASSEILSVVFRATCSKSEIRMQPEEIFDAKFVSLTEENIEEYITRPHMVSRTLDAMLAEDFIPYETWEVRPYNLLGRLDKAKFQV